jgi:hypothetical protein
VEQNPFGCVRLSRVFRPGKRMETPPVGKDDVNGLTFSAAVENRKFTNDAAWLFLESQAV